MMVMIIMVNVLDDEKLFIKFFSLEMRRNEKKEEEEYKGENDE